MNLLRRLPGGILHFYEIITTKIAMETASAKIRTTSRPRCFICGSEGQGLYKSLSDPLFGTPGLWALKKCPQMSCGLIWLDPSPVEGDLHLAYQTYFTHGDQDGRESASTRLHQFLYRVYLALQSAPAAMIGLGAAKKRRRQMYLDDLQPGKLLDVGCGDGTFLNSMRQVGWKTEGVDFDPKAIANAKANYGLELKCGDLRSANFPDQTFNAITMSHVIEHLLEPLPLLNEIRRILKPGGRLILTTPNSGSFGHEKFREYWFGIDPPRHVNIYSLNALRECARLVNLRVLTAMSTAAYADIFIGGSFSIRDSPDHKTTPHPRLDVSRIVKTIYLHCREHFQLKSRSECGEEAVLICLKEGEGRQTNV